MNILSFDTSTNILRAGLSTPEGWSENIRSTGLRHGENLILMVQSLLEEAALFPKDLDLIVCTKGPGSFTGLRIGLSTAKGLSEGSGVPLVAISTLQVYGSLYSFFPGTVVPLLDAKKNQFYAGFYEKGTLVMKESDIPAELILEGCTNRGQILFTGPGLGIFMERCPDLENNPDYYFDHYEKNSFCNILSVLGEDKFNKEGPDSPESGPAYLRASDAELGR
ncbi:MAG: tRNA (adenosine(37)-N6)-threonylcarbamoyltransferase complex dimerization subunit type 1 TsaB [Spirochaetales bacterium]|nr:tRNA (adenosine(37)-N6)-threonylcarbamoyltransferase complex dimerization subunit type 1 TsaB [Spirochaetales bacterium]